MQIIKPNCKFITTEQRPQILKLLEKKCKKENAEFLPIKTKAKNRNNLIAQKIGELLKIRPKAIEKALAKTKLPCRFETIQTIPKIIIDGAHNRIKLRKVAESLEIVKRKKLIILFSMTAGKNTIESMKEIAHLADHIIFTRTLSLPGNRRTVPLHEFQKNVKKLKIKAKINYFLDPWQAMSYAISNTSSKDCLLITGSMYMAGALREKWINEKYILKNRSSF
ncbi:hypothetical protein K8R66_01300 [bacterium]|nr:hypothetical protein [bacterium]